MMKYRENTIPSFYFSVYGGKGVDPDKNEESKGT